MTKTAVELKPGDTITYADSTFGSTRTAEVASVFANGPDTLGTPMVTVRLREHADPTFPGLRVMPFAMYVPASHVFGGDR